MPKRLDWNRWCEVFQDPTFFEPIIVEICDDCGWDRPVSIKPLTPGTNGVFAVDGRVFKVFVPDDVKPWKENDFLTEVFHIERAVSLGVNTPNILAKGRVIREHIWHYIVMEYITGIEAGIALKQFGSQEKLDFANHMRDLIGKMHRSDTPFEVHANLIKRVVEGKRWGKYCDTLQRELYDYLAALDLSVCSYVHGDLTAENLLIDHDGTVSIIDFADSVVAPIYYEYAPICFDLFDCDRAMIEAFFESKSIDHIVDELLKGLLIHDFGGDILKTLVDKTPDYSIENLKHLDDVKRFLRDIYLCNSKF